MKKFLTIILLFLFMTLMSLTSSAQKNHIGCGFNLVVVVERDSIGNLITYYAHSGKNVPIDNKLEEIISIIYFSNMSDEDKQLFYDKYAQQFNKPKEE